VDGETGTTFTVGDVLGPPPNQARLPLYAEAVMGWLVVVALFAVLLALSPPLASISAVLALVGLVVWRLALLC
jgi:hypothetical protein